jgi:perosamine synthetase
MHCRTMPEAAEHAGAPVLYYPMTEQLQPDFAAWSRLLSARATPAAAAVHVHYFGFPQGLDEMAALCRDHGLKRVEDCSHAFYGQRTDPHGAALGLLGTWGDYAVSSSWKFHPVPYGAVLLDHTEGGQNRRRGAPWDQELRSWVDWARTGKDASGTPEPDRAVPPVARLWERACELAAAQHAAAGSGASSFKAAWAQGGAPRLYQRAVQQANHAHIVAQRRHHYLQWLAFLQGVPGVQPLFSQLPAGVVPYAFPLLGDEHGVLFHLLKLAGVPVWRWEDMARVAPQQCPVTARYRVRLLQLACHQSLTENDLAWMAQTVVSCAQLVAQRQAELG